MALWATQGILVRVVFILKPLCGSNCTKQMSDLRFKTSRTIEEKKKKEEIGTEDSPYSHTQGSAYVVVHLEHELFLVLSLAKGIIKRKSGLRIPQQRWGPHIVVLSPRPDSFGRSQAILSQICMEDNLKKRLGDLFSRQARGGWKEGGKGINFINVIIKWSALRTFEKVCKKMFGRMF
ncbi:hypothetical protein BDZ91DRAFT_236205 [Kalaharituber pfeilii]|nr:hypothetical protein BDZ91DRAFT_236205 [Kalaharituber pfeilii]